MFWYGLCGPQGGSCGGSGALAEAGTLFISGTVLWFILALIVAAVEMVTGTVYLLAVTLACAAAGAASWLTDVFCVVDFDPIAFYRISVKITEQPILNN